MNAERKTPPKPEIAIVYDFDGTLIDHESILPMLDDLDIDNAKFWRKCDDYAAEHNIDTIGAYLLKVFQVAEEKKIELSPSYLNELGRRLKLRATADWFDGLNRYAHRSGYHLNHYIVSSGIEEVMRGCPLVHKYFRAVFGTTIHRLPNGGLFPGRIINYTSKTQYMFRISKGMLDMRDEYAPNEKRNERPVPFNRMIFIGDGYTDIPCFALMKEYGGFPIAVLGNKPRKYKLIEQLVRDKRVDVVSLEDHFGRDGVLNAAIQDFIHNLGKPEA